MAFTGNKAWYLSSTKYSSVTQWATGTVKAVGDIVRQLAAPTVGNERIFVCVIAGTTNATTEPTWTVTRGAKNTDNTVTWQECTGVAALNGDLTNTPTWATVKNTAVSLGHVITSNDGQVTLICDTAGTAGNGAEPTWSTTDGNTTADNTVTWRTLKHGGAKFGNWAAPHARFASVQVTNWADQASQDIYATSDHAETQTTAISNTGRGTTSTPHRLISVSGSGSVPPVAADITSGASITTTGAVNITLTGALTAKGFTFSAGTSGNTKVITNNSTTDCYYEDCAFVLGTGTGGGSGSQFGPASATTLTKYKNCTFKFANATQGIVLTGNQEFEGCSLDPASTLPTGGLFNGSSLTESSNEYAIFRGCDWSLLGSNLLVQIANVRNQYILFEDCKLGSGTLFNHTQTPLGADQTLTFYRCSGAAGELILSHFMRGGSHVIATDIARHLGAQDPAGNQYCWKFSTNGDLAANVVSPFKSLKMGAYNTDDTHDVSVTLYGIANAASMPTNADIWADVHYLGAAGNPQSSIKSSKPATLLTAGTSLTADTHDWDDNGTARQNGHVYSVGDKIVLASNPGRVFFCTTGGTSAGSEPGGYSSAVDGGSVTDNTAVFRAGFRFAITVLLTSPAPAQVGNLYAYIYATIASTDFWIDPQLDLEQSSS